MTIPYEKLSKMVFFLGLPEEAIKEFSKNSKLVNFSAGESIISENNPATEFYLIRKGSVKICSANPDAESPTQVQRIGVGEVLGWSWLFAPYIWSFEGVAENEVEAIKFDGTKLRHYCENNKEIGYDVLKRFSKLMSLRLLEVRMKLSEQKELIHPPQMIA